MEDPESVLLISAASIWEISIKSALGKLVIPDNLLEEAETQGFQYLDVTAPHAWRLRRLPVTEHKDPFDRLLVIQALYEKLPIISDDEQLDQYHVQRHW